jgi:hypothetical protein
LMVYVVGENSRKLAISRAHEMVYSSLSGCSGKKYRRNYP